MMPTTMSMNRRRRFQRGLAERSVADTSVVRLMSAQRTAS